jgi:hypothetical protein
MSDNGPCNCAQALALQQRVCALEDLLRSTGIAQETRALLYWASQTKWDNTHSNFAYAVNRWKEAGEPDLPAAPFCPHCGQGVTSGDTEHAAGL